MKILLTQPFAGFIENPPNIPDLGLGYIARHLMKKGFETIINDWNMDFTAALFQKWLVDHQFDVVGVKVFTKDVRAAQETVSLIKAALPESVVVIGGPHPSCAQPGEVMASFPLADYAFRGEAELSFPKLVQAVDSDFSVNKNGKARREILGKIPGLIWRDDGEVKFNGIEFVNDLDCLDTPEWGIADPNRYAFDLIAKTGKEGAAAPIITTRGCPGRCSFCSAYLVNGRKIRSRDPLHVAEEIRFIKERYGVEKFSFMDNCFTARIDHLKGVCDALIRNKLDIRWDCNCYEMLGNLNHETIPLMYRSGCRMVHMGIESASEKIRKQMNKFSSLHAYTEKINQLKRNNISVGAWFMIGFPDESFADMLQTVKYAFSINVDLLTFTICFPLPGSQLHSFLREKYSIHEIEWSGFDVEKSQYPLSRISSLKLKCLLKGIRLAIFVRDKIRALK